MKYREYGIKSGCHCHEIKEKDILIHLQEFLKLTKKVYISEIEKVKIELISQCKTNNKSKLEAQYKLLNEEYKLLVTQKIKDLATAIDANQKETIVKTYGELEKEKATTISNIRQLIDKLETVYLKEKTIKLQSAVDYFDKIINDENPGKYMLESLIEQIWIYSDKSVKFDLKPDIKNLILY